MNLKLWCFCARSDELEDTKAQNSVDALELIDATLDEIKMAGVVAGCCGLVIYKRYFKVVDSELENSQGMVCGGNEDNFHL